MNGSSANQPSVTVYDFTVKDIDGRDVALAAFRGKTLLIVNVASRCGYTPQYEGLQKLYLRLKDRGLVVMGFPANEFGGQEPGSDEEIKAFCTSKYDVTFPMFAKVAVKGPGQSPLFRHLTGQAAPDAPPGEIQWNFEKFLVNSKGQVVNRFRSKVKPESDVLVQAIEAALPSR